MADISDEMLASAATLFSTSYGTWGPQAASKMDSSFKAGIHAFTSLYFHHNKTKTPAKELLGIHTLYACRAN